MPKFGRFNRIGQFFRTLPEEWTKLARVDPPGNVFHIQSEFGTFLQGTDFTSY